MKKTAAFWISILATTLSLPLFAAENKATLVLKKDSPRTSSEQKLDLKRKSDQNPKSDVTLDSLRRQDSPKPQMDLKLGPDVPEPFREKMDSLKLDGGIHGGGGGNSYCAELADLYESIRLESGSSNEPSGSLRCYPINDQATVIDFFRNNLILDWQKWSALSEQDKIWELSKVFLTIGNRMRPASDEQVDSFMLKLLNTSPVFSSAKFFESLSRSGNSMTFEKPMIPVKGNQYRIGYEYWCWYGKPCSELQFQPWGWSDKPEALPWNFCRLLGYNKVAQVRWSEHMPHSIVPGLEPNSHSHTLANIARGVFNGTFQTHAYGPGYTAVLESVTCER